jgi:3'-phosphoadenosine 5'-phosphosulfate (PAPS) 3'-phosphatase
MGGAGKKSLTILEGQADLFIYLGTRMSKWDICAPEALVRAFGVKRHLIREIFWDWQVNSTNMMQMRNHLTIHMEHWRVFTQSCFKPTLIKQQVFCEI